MKVSSSKNLAILQQIFYSFAIKIVSVLLNFLYVPLLLNVFKSKEEYGIWLTVSSIALWFSVFDIGLGNGLRNKLTEAIAINDMKLCKKLISTTYITSFFIFSFIGIFFLLINRYVNWNKILNSTLDLNYLIGFTNVVFSIFFLRFIFQLIGVVYISFQKPAVNNLIITIGNTIGLVVLLLFKNYIELDLISCAYIIMGTPLIFMILVTVYAFSDKFASISPEIKSFDKIHLKGLMGLGVNFFIMQFSAILLFSTGNFLVSHFFSPQEVIIYNTAFTFFQLPIIAYAIVMGPVWSAVTDAIVKNEMDWLRQGLQKLNILSCIFVTGIVFLLVISDNIYKLWVGNKIEIPFIISFSMALYAIISVVLSPYTSFINGSGRIYISVLLSIFSIIVFIPLAYFFSKILNSPAAIMFSICLVNGASLLIQPKQVYKIIDRSANGVWNK